jgi:hypothetical protein
MVLFTELSMLSNGDGWGGLRTLPYFWEELEH